MTTLPNAQTPKRPSLSFTCDYNEGAHPEILHRLIETNMLQEDGYGDENLHPTNPPADPYFTPVGETPWWFILALGALYLLTTVLRKKTQAFSY